MLTAIHPKLPMRDKSATKKYYIDKLGFRCDDNYPDYLMVEKDGIEIHFFEFKGLDPKENYGQVYIRTNDIDTVYQSLLDNKVGIHPNAPLQNKPWGQREFSLLDPDNNLLTFGQSL
jgi:catechol 2,3-dioxygenase-like lactoylglutathione lyase family enzyme